MISDIEKETKFTNLFKFTNLIKIKQSFSIEIPTQIKILSLPFFLLLNLN